MNLLEKLRLFNNELIKENVRLSKIYKKVLAEAKAEQEDIDETENINEGSLGKILTHGLVGGAIGAGLGAIGSDKIQDLTKDSIKNAGDVDLAKSDLDTFGHTGEGADAKNIKALDDLVDRTRADFKIGTKGDADIMASQYRNAPADFKDMKWSDGAQAKYDTQTADIDQLSRVAKHSVTKGAEGQPDTEHWELKSADELAARYKDLDNKLKFSDRALATVGNNPVASAAALGATAGAVHGAFSDDDEDRRRVEETEELDANNENGDPESFFTEEDGGEQSYKDFIKGATQNEAEEEIDEQDAESEDNDYVGPMSLSGEDLFNEDDEEGDEEDQSSNEKANSQEEPEMSDEEFFKPTMPSTTSMTEDDYNDMLECSINEEEKSIPAPNFFGLAESDNEVKDATTFFRENDDEMIGDAEEEIPDDQSNDDNTDDQSTTTDSEAKNPNNSAQPSNDEQDDSNEMDEGDKGLETWESFISDDGENTNDEEDSEKYEVTNESLRRFKRSRR